MTANVVELVDDIQQVSTELVYLTPRDAAEWLDKYRGPNRRLAEQRVLQFQSDMESGRWHFDGAPLRLSEEGKLLDGQHRLTALATCEGDVEIPFLVVRGLTPDSQLVMDQGGARTAGQQLGLKGIPHANSVSAAAKLLLDWTRGRLFQSQTRAQTTKPETVGWVLDHPELVEELLDTPFLRIDAPSSVVGAFMLATLQFAPNRARQFLQRLHTGVGLAEGDPILALDRRLRAIRRTNVRVSQREYLASFIKAWNAWVSGNSLQKIQIGKLDDSNYPKLLKVADIKAAK